MLRAGGPLMGQWVAHGEITPHLFPWEGGREGPGEARGGTLMQWPCKCETRPAVSGITWDHLSQKQGRSPAV